MVGAYKCGVKAAKISRKLGVHDATVKSVIKKFNNEGTVESIPRSGRPNIHSERNVRSLIRITRNNRSGTVASFTGELNHALSKPKPLVTEHSRKKRKFCKSLWSEMIFIDSHKWVWRTAPREVRCKLLSSKSCTFSWCYVKGS